jgi:hypothetical protein
MTFSHWWTNYPRRYRWLPGARHFVIDVAIGLLCFLLGALALIGLFALTPY